MIGPIRQQAPYPRFVGEDAPAPRGAPRLGEHTDAVLHEMLDLSPGEIAAFRASGAVV